MKLTAIEQETIILYNQAEATAEVETYDARLLEKLNRLFGSLTAPSAARPPVIGQRPPDICRLSESPAVKHGRESF